MDREAMVEVAMKAIARQDTHEVDGIVELFSEDVSFMMPVLAAPLQVLAEDSGTPAAGVGITWTLVSGSATITPAGPTDPTGTASATLTAGAVDGPVVISATRQDAPGATVTFNLTISALGTLVVVEGDDQTLLAGIPSDPLQVELRDGGGAPVAGATITWSTTAGTPVRSGVWS